jgi:hypothetical protein
MVLVNYWVDKNDIIFNDLLSVWMPTEGIYVTITTPDFTAKYIPFSFVAKKIGFSFEPLDPIDFSFKII